MLIYWESIAAHHYKKHGSRSGMGNLWPARQSLIHAGFYFNPRDDWHVNCILKEYINWFRSSYLFFCLNKILNTIFIEFHRYYLIKIIIILVSKFIPENPKRIKKKTDLISNQDYKNGSWKLKIHLNNFIDSLIKLFCRGILVFI